jgi:hypothetical protein
MVTRTHCLRGHDLARDGATRFVGGRFRCVECYLANNKKGAAIKAGAACRDPQHERVARPGGKGTYCYTCRLKRRREPTLYSDCGRCRKPKEPSQSRYCSDACRRDRKHAARCGALAGGGLAGVQDEFARAREEQRLTDELERNPPAWRAIEIRAERDRLRGAG